MKTGKRILIIGGVACGPKAAARARRCDPDARITIVEQGSLISYASCGLPYYVSGTIQRRGALLVRSAQDFANISEIDVLLATRADEIDRSAHSVRVTNMVTGERSALEYDKLVLATGANAVMPRIEGRDLRGIYPLKNVPDADLMLAEITGGAVKKVIIVGAGLIGIEMCDVLLSRGLQVTVVEAMDRALPGALDEEIAAPLGRYLTRKGVDLRLGERVVRFEGQEGKVQRVVTDRAAIDADIVVVGVGVRPNVELARQAGLLLGPTGAIAVTDTMLTNDPDIYAGGDCTENTHLVTGAKVFMPMGSTANKHGRVIGTNVTGGHETFPGVAGTTVVKAMGYHVGRTGLGEKDARDAGFDVVTALVGGTDRPNYYPGSRDMILKLIADRNTGRVLGGQATGWGEVVKRIDVLAAAITMGSTLDNLANLDLGYAPPYNSPIDLLEQAANVIKNKLDGMAEGLTPAQLKTELDSKEDFVLLDVRSQREWDTWRLDDPRARLVPQNALLQKLGELPHDRRIVTFCRGGTRAYQAALTLRSAGFEGVRFTEGSMLAWPYDCFGGEKEPGSS